MNPKLRIEKLDQKVWMVNGAENILDFYVSRTNRLKKDVKCCYDYFGPILIRKTQPIWENNLKVDKRGIKIKFLTEIRNENLQYCKKMLEEIKHIEMRHMDGIKGNFVLHDDKEYFLPFFVGKPEEPESRNALFCTQEEMVEAHLFIFENLWRQATPAHLRIKELEEGIPTEVLQSLSEPEEIINAGYTLVRLAKYEILIIFHTANALIRQDKAGGIDLLVENVVKYKTHVKILVPIEDAIKDIIQMLEKINGIQIRNIEKTMETGMTVLVVDKKYSLVVELRDDTKDDLKEAIGLATYSNSKSTVLSYVSIFDALWKQSELREELLNLSMAQKEFINIAAHELRNPIQPILGLSDVLLRSNFIIYSNKSSGIKHKEIVEIIARNAKRLQRLTDDILDITRIEGKSLKLNKQRFVLSETIREIIQDLNIENRDLNQKAILSFDNNSSIESISVTADQNRIKQVITNLIDNAMKFTPAGEITIAIEIDNKDNRVIIRVKDTGTGISSDILPKLFTKFVSRSEKGTGLGLYICKGIIEAHNGRIWAENNYDKNPSLGGSRSDSNNKMRRVGATFSFSLPLLHV
jgi:two-component system, OmpR family, sensor histidine kinase VicK